jgi:hypothetical protein
MHENRKGNQMSENKSKELSFVTRKVLVTFTHPVCLMLGDTAVFTNAAICEYNEAQDDRFREKIPASFTVVGTADGRKMSRSLQLHTAGFGVVSAMVELDADGKGA